MEKTYFDVLGIDDNATIEAVKATYADIPDSKRTNEIEEAYKILSNPTTFRQHKRDIMYQRKSGVKRISKSGSSSSIRIAPETSEEKPTRIDNKTIYEYALEQKNKGEYCRAIDAFSLIENYENYIDTLKLIESCKKDCNNFNEIEQKIFDLKLKMLEYKPRLDKYYDNMNSRLKTMPWIFRVMGSISTIFFLILMYPLRRLVTQYPLSILFIPIFSIPLTFIYKRHIISKNKLHSTARKAEKEIENLNVQYLICYSKCGMPDFMRECKEKDFSGDCRDYVKRLDELHLLESNNEINFAKRGVEANHKVLSNIFLYSSLFFGFGLVIVLVIVFGVLFIFENLDTFSNDCFNNPTSVNVLTVIMSALYIIPSALLSINIGNRIKKNRNKKYIATFNSNYKAAILKERLKECKTHCDKIV